MAFGQVSNPGSDRALLGQLAGSGVISGFTLAALNWAQAITIEITETATIRKQKRLFLAVTA